MDRQYSLGTEEVARLLQRTEGEVQLAAALMVLGGLRAVEVAELRHRDVVVGPTSAMICVRRGNKVDSVKAVGLLHELHASRTSRRCSRGAWWRRDDHRRFALRTYRPGVQSAYELCATEVRDIPAGGTH